MTRTAAGPPGSNVTATPPHDVIMMQSEFEVFLSRKLTVYLQLFIN